MNNLTKYKLLINTINNTAKKINNNYINFISANYFNNYILKKNKNYRDYIEQWDNDFNLFKVISPKYYYEKLHSDIIYTIFNLETPDIKNEEYLKLFIKLLNRNIKIKIKHDFGERYRVEKEKQIEDDKGSIDILISDEEYAIIIENKINNAPDTNNQLAKYYKYVKEKMNLTVVAVVYLPLDPDKKPMLEYYYDGYENYEPEIRNVLTIIPVISKDGKDDFVHGFISFCCSLSKDINNQIALMFFEQYKKLLKYLGGNFMATKNDKELFLELYKTKESISIVKDIMEIMKNRSFFTYLTFCDKFIPELEKTEMKFESYDNGHHMRAKIAESIDDIYLGFHNYYEKDKPLKDEQLFFGFSSEKKIKGKKLAKLKSILNEKEFNDYFGEVEDLDWNNNPNLYMVFKRIRLHKNEDENEPISKKIDFFTKLLIRKYSELKDISKKKL
jgi:hypothetical protein